jgi:hypothetical protein
MARNYVQGKDYRLAGAGVAATDTSITLTSMQLPNSNALITMADFGEIGFITFEPETNREENASFTGITQNLNGSATLTGVTRGLTFVSPSTTDNALRKSHSGGSIVRVSNSVQFYENLANKYNSQTIKGVWTFNADADGANPVIDDPDYVPSDDEYIVKKYAVEQLPNDPAFIANLEAAGIGSSIEVEENGVSVETGVNKINILSNSPIVTNPATGEVDIDLTNLGGSGGANLLYDAWDDFLSSKETTFSDNTSYSIGTLNWSGDVNANNTIGDMVDGEADHTGIFRLEGAGTTNPYLQLGAADTGIYPLYDIAKDGTVYNTIIRLPLATDDCYITIEGGSGGEISINFDNGTGDYSFVTNDGGGPETTNLGAYAAGDWYEIKIECNTADIKLYIGVNGATPTLVATHTTIPTPAAGTFRYGCTGGQAMDIDFFGMKYGRVLTSPSSGSVINLTAGEDLTAGDTVGYASFIDDTAMKAVWAYRINSTGSLGYTVDGVRAVCEIDTDKYAILFETSEAGVNTPYRAVISTLDRDTLTWSFGTPSAIIKRPSGDAISLCKVDTDKFIMSYLNDSVPAELGVKACTVSGTTIAIGAEDTYTSPDNGDLTDLTYLAPDRVAVLISTGGYSGQDAVLIEITVSGSTATIGSPTLIAGITNGLGLIEKIDTDKVAIVYGDSVIIATVSGGTWTVGTPVTLPSSIVTGQLYGQISINSKDTDEFWVIADRTSNVRYLHYTVSGTTPTLNASGTYADAGNDVVSLMNDGTDMFLFAQSSDALLSGVAKLTINGASIDISPFVVKYTSASLFVGSTSHVKNMMINASGYYGQLSTDSPGATDELNVPFHIKGMTNLFIGVAQSTTARGATVPVLIAGVDDNQTGLTTGALYDAFEGGIVATGTQLFNTMQAQNSTDLKI